MYNLPDSDTKSVLYEDLIAILVGALQDQILKMVDIERKLQQTELSMADMYSNEAKLIAKVEENDRRIEQIEEQLKKLSDIIRAMNGEAPLIT